MEPESHATNGTLFSKENVNGTHHIMENGSKPDVAKVEIAGLINGNGCNGNVNITKQPPVSGNAPNAEGFEHPDTSDAIHVYDPERDLLNQSFPGSEGDSNENLGASGEHGDVLDGQFFSRNKQKHEKAGLKVHRPLNGNENVVNSDSLDARPVSIVRPGVPIARAPRNVVSSYRYAMDYPHRGYAVIIDNRTFSMENTPYRSGSERDAENLEKSMVRLGFKTKRFENLSVVNLVNAMDYYSKKDHSDSDCFFCAIFSHGEEGVIFGTDGKITLSQLTSPFRGDKCLSLAGKPKIFVVQACRGEKLDAGVDLVEADAPCTYRVPAEADFLYAFATAPGYFAWRNTQLGSWFIQSLCNALDNHAYDLDMDLLKLLTRVNYEVAFAHESNVPSDKKWHRKKQIPSIVSMLTKDLVLAPKNPLQMDTSV